MCFILTSGKLAHSQINTRQNKYNRLSVFYFKTWQISIKVQLALDKNTLLFNDYYYYYFYQLCKIITECDT